MAKGNKGKNKQPKHSQSPLSRKVATHAKNPEGYQNQFIGWHFQCMDQEGTWPCDCMAIVDFMHLLCEYEKMKWSEALQDRNNHPMPLDQICRAAQRRIEELGYGGAENLYQLKIKGAGGKQRLWGLRVENIFQILWWDPNHTVYPMPR